MKRIMIVLAAMTFAFTSCDILSGLLGDDTENTDNEDGDGQEPGDGTDEPSVPPVELLPRKVTGMKVTNESGSNTNTFTYYADGRLKEWRSESERPDGAGYGYSRVETYRYEYSGDRINAFYSELEEQPSSDPYRYGYEIVGIMEGDRVMEMSLSAEDGDSDFYTLKYDGNGFIVGYGRMALSSLEGTASFKVEDGMLSGFSCEVTFLDEGESAKNAGTVIPSRYENNLSIDLYPVFVYLGETLWRDHMPVFLAPGISRYRYLPERVEYRSSWTSESGSQSEDRIETYEYVMSGDYIKKVIYDDGYGEPVTYEFFYE